jgi:hypothetical protein
MTPAEKFERMFWEMDYRIKHLEHAMMQMTEFGNIPVLRPLICVNASCDTGRTMHPHWQPIPTIDWARPIIGK